MTVYARRIWTHCTSKKGKPKYSRDDVIGCGVNLASGRIIFTKNGQPLDTADLFVCPSSPSANDDDDDAVDHRLFPCVSLADSGDLIEANFGPNFKFDPANAEEFLHTKQRNCWDLAVYHNEITISGPHNLIVHHKGNGNGWRFVFAKYSNLHKVVTESIDMFYFEVKVKNMKRIQFIFFHFYLCLRWICRQKSDIAGWNNSKPHRHLRIRYDHQKQLERISELEKQQTVIFDQLNTAQKQMDERISQPQTDQQPMELCAKISELETNTNLLFGKILDEFSEFGNFVGILKDRFGREAESAWVSVSVFAKYSVPSSEIGGLFYFEVKIIHLRNCAKIGFSTKAMAFCEKAEGLYSYGKPKYSRDDVIGCGVNLASGRIIFTKNGQPLDTADLFVCPSSPSANDDDDDAVDHRLFPCVSLADSGDLIEANFGPNFKFDPANAEVCISVLSIA
ncbi:hypothetical protein niasHT_014586 [Heterodera trifolii]|uniref:B30.2/SPRY domain-containing protein n=1 Tax=Heterodera trifolii TaxID=157864 RepID=A0ABD2LHQ6_9BILA